MTPPLTDKGRQALHKALHVPITPNHDGKLPFRPIVLATLIRHGYLTETDNDGPAYHITAAGKAALARETPRFLHARLHHNYTTNPALAATGEPEPVDNTTLDQYAQHAEQQRARTTHDARLARDQLALDQRIAQALTQANALGLDIRRQRANVQAAIAAMERRIRRNTP